MSKFKSNLVWIDLEMTGLNDDNVIIEIATLITDSNLEILEEGPSIAIHRTTEEMSTMEEWSLKHHTESGLLKRVHESNISLQDAEKLTIQFLSKWVKTGEAPLCGNSVHIDRRFLRKEMPLLEQFLHYHIIDVSSVKQLARRWYPNQKEPQKKREHLALADIRESVEELRWYRENIFQKSTKKDDGNSISYDVYE